MSLLAVNLVARTRTFDKNMKRSSKRINSFHRNANAARSAVMGFAKAMVAVAAAGGAVMLIKNTMQAIDATGKLARRLAITTEELIKLRYAAEITGAGTEALDKALQKMAKSIGDVELGSLDAKYALDALGLDAGILKSKNAAEQFLTVADALKNVKNQTDKLAIAQKLFGRGGAPIVNMLMLERAGLEELGREAEKLGITFSNLDAEKVERANDAMLRVKRVCTERKQLP